MKRKTHISKKRNLSKDGVKIEYFGNYGDISNDSVVTDIYRKMNRKRQLKNSVAQGTKVVKRIATDEEKEKYVIKD